ncbi:MAG: hypothetical protein AUK48_09290 [Oscillatoriales cyanobacterium CG2_30_44_21]|nr:MAG: hypothetical protein AUK48_09290 [Oscillatoriales cyanobacterium CG2_30_44_21]
MTQDVEAYADNVDNLMDDLFGEVEHTLHVDHAKQRSLKSQNSQPRSIKKSAPYATATANDVVALAKLDSSSPESFLSKDSVSITKLNMADISLPPISKQDVLWIQPYIMRNPEPPSDIPPVAPDSEPKHSLLDRLLIVAACSSALIAAVMWTINHGIWIGKQSVIVPQVAQSTTNDRYNEEVKKMLASAVNKNRNIATNGNNSLGSNLPLLATPLAGNLPLGANPLMGMQQPMYVPVYQPPALSNNSPSPLALPPATSSNVVELNGSPTSANSPSAIAPPVTVQPTDSYTLVGILDLGDRSMAMLDINGSVQSIGLGKPVTGTSWTLSRVSQQEITLRRGKETKNVFVGQKF